MHSRLNNPEPAGAKAGDERLKTLTNRTNRELRVYPKRISGDNA